MDRERWIYQYREQFVANNNTMDYMILLDVDLHVIGKVGSEILGETIAVLHPCSLYFDGTEILNENGTDCPRGKPGEWYNQYPVCTGNPWEERPQSEAHIVPSERYQYYRGGFFGGTTNEFFTMCGEVADQMDRDHQNSITASVKDESHVVKYFHKHKPAKVLTVTYLYPLLQHEKTYKSMWYPWFFITLPNGSEVRRYEPRIVSAK